MNAVPHSAPALTGARLQFDLPARLFVLAGLLVAIVPFARALAGLFEVWNVEPEYSHGVLIPPISLYLLWRERNWLARTPFTGAWSGLLVVALGLGLWLIGEMSTITAIVNYGFLIVLYGLVISLTGWAVFRHLWMPFLILVFMIPLPQFFAANLSLKLQLLSSQLGVSLIRLFGISVFLEGNVIDLGAYQLEVAEACNGLRYLFPLMTLAFILAYFFRVPVWKRAVLFLSSIPIAILLNSARIGVIGVTVEHWGQKMAEGLLHDFEGWVVFMLSTLVLLGIARVLLRIGSGPKMTFREALSFDPPAVDPAAASQPVGKRRLPAAFVAGAALATVASIVAFAMPARTDEVFPKRSTFVQFPNHLNGWSGRRQPLEQVYIDALKVDDYILSDYRSGGASQVPVNLYVAYYDSQQKGRSVHSPRSCIPGGGWAITSFTQTTLPTAAGGAGVPVNRAVIELGKNKQIVYYWFQQRGRAITNEYLVKWYIFWDALTRSRTDGALVRLSAPMLPGMDEAAVDKQIGQFATAAVPQLREYIPD